LTWGLVRSNFSFAMISPKEQNLCDV